MSNLTNILFSEAVKVHVLNDGAALSVAKYPTSTNFIPVGGVHRFAVLGIVNAVNTATVIQVQQAVDDDSTPKDITGAVKTIAADGSDDGKWFIIEVETSHMDINNDYKFVTVDVSGAAGANDLVTLLLLEFAGETIPVTQADLDEAVNVVGQE